ncbi:MAG: L-histidine N(alpha)-methyltransferase [Balneola sp.]
MTELELLSKKTSMLEEVIEGLSQDQKSLPSKFFYDEKGSKLFDEITELDEYYPTRTERKILEQNVTEIAEYLGEEVLLVEPGSGSSSKTKILLKNMDNICCYIPMDISGDYLYKVAEQLREQFPSISILPLSADYTKPFTLPEESPDARKVVFYPGSTIGNFKKEKVEQFLKVVHDIIGEDGAFLIGVDLKKNIAVLEAAYNDSKGITAAFNKNILTHIDKQLGTSFDANMFKHQSIWNEEKGRIEMHLFVQEEHSVKVGDRIIDFKKGESIHTENSHKYTLTGFSDMIADWFEVKKVWTDEKNYFSVQYLEPK